MDKTEIEIFFIKDLWQNTNLVTGFSVVQAVGFIYACTREEFINLINTFWVKLFIAIHLILVSSVLSYAVWWCAKRCTLLVENRISNENDRSNIISMINKSTYGRILFILWLIIPMLLSLYSRQLGGLPFNP
jgi:hypothetical protein